MKEVDPKETTRAYAFEMWMKAPMPMVTVFKRLNVTRLAKISKNRGLKFNMLMCWCIGKAAQRIKEFYLLPVNGKLIQYDTIAVNAIISNIMRGVSSCDIPFSDFSDELSEYGKNNALSIHVMNEDIFNSMHRI